MEGPSWRLGAVSVEFDSFCENESNGTGRLGFVFVDSTQSAGTGGIDDASGQCTGSVGTGPME